MMSFAKHVLKGNKPEAHSNPKRLDLCGPMRVKTPKGKQYLFVIVDDFSRFTWVLFLREKLEALAKFSKLYRVPTISKNLPIASIRSDHGREFDKLEFSIFCDKHGISYNFSAPRTPQQNGVVETKNRTLEDISRIILLDNHFRLKL